MARETKYNNITSQEKLNQIAKNNLTLKKDFLEYLQSIDRSEGTIAQYSSDLNIFFVWNLDNNDNKDFVNITKRDFAKFQNHALNEWGWSPKRIRRVKSTLSYISNFIENILDEEPEYENYRSIVKKIESPVNVAVREKTVFEKEELQKLLDYLVEKKKYRQACAVALAMYSGRRKSELPRFKVSFFDEKNVLFGSLYKSDEKIRTKGRGRNGKGLFVYVLKKSFDPYLNLWLKERKELGIESEWLFPDKEDYTKQINVETLNGWADTYTKFLGKDFYWHSLRHFFTTELAKNNIPTNVIKDIQGWDSVEMVSVYSDLSVDDNIGKYFDENGIKQIEQKSLADI